MPIPIVHRYFAHDVLKKSKKEIGKSFVCFLHMKNYRFIKKQEMFIKRIPIYIFLIIFDS